MGESVHVVGSVSVKIHVAVCSDDIFFSVCECLFATTMDEPARRVVSVWTGMAGKTLNVCRPLWKGLTPMEGVSL